jgi:hypothetical protein
MNANYPSTNLREEFRPGDHIAASRLLYTHHGIYAGGRRVIHYQEKGFKIDETSFDDFKGVAPLSVYVAPLSVYKVHHSSPKYSPKEVVARAKSRLGESQYNIATNNCEHFCNWCVDGQETSGQVGFFVESLFVSSLKTVVDAASASGKKELIKSAILSVPLVQASNSAVNSIISASTLPIMLGTLGWELYPVIKKFAKGEIGVQAFLEEAGGKGTAFFSGMLLGTITQSLIPIPVVGFMAGSIIGYSLSSLLYNSAFSVFANAKRAREEYLRTKERCESLRLQLDHYRKESDIWFKKYFSDLSNTLHNSMDMMDKAYRENDPDSYARYANAFADRLGVKLQFSTFNEFKEFIKSGRPLNF